MANQIYAWNPSQSPLNPCLLHRLLLLDAKLYAALAWYLERVLPGGYGPRQHWAFVLRPSYRCAS